ncbi:MAG: hypothetical protein JOZ53_05470 [Planctomycetaceae bacterium]|nr:hypothetical protein [Planctomycetaceae bacterium]
MELDELLSGGADVILRHGSHGSDLLTKGLRDDEPAGSSDLCSLSSFYQEGEAFSAAVELVLVRGAKWTAFSTSGRLARALQMAPSALLGVFCFRRNGKTGPLE